MKGKKGIIFAIFIFLIVALFVIAGLIYFKIRFLGGFEYKTGNVIFNIDYEKEKSIPLSPQNISLNMTNSTLSQNVSLNDFNITTD
ncbi:MAG: hypothetical protein Q7S27_05875 [Nanoarchaeota archaeon]|nr:hypothetical protein [Nanoarchaeota archaeon]